MKFAFQTVRYYNEHNQEMFLQAYYNQTSSTWTIKSWVWAMRNKANDWYQDIFLCIYHMTDISS